MTVVFTSDSSVTAAGFEATLTAAGGGPSPPNPSAPPSVATAPPVSSATTVDWVMP